MRSSDRARADVAAAVDIAHGVRVARRAAQRFLEQHDEQRETTRLAHLLLDALIEPGRARLEAALTDTTGV